VSGVAKTRVGPAGAVSGPARPRGVGPLGWGVGRLAGAWGRSAGAWGLR